MKVTLLSPGVILASFPRQKDLVLTMCRVQEFYEAYDARLRGQPFSWSEFLEVFTSDDGTFTYFHDWAGFNIPDNAFIAWASNVIDPSEREFKLVEAIRAIVTDDSMPFYVIAMLDEDTDVLDHEVAHARFYLDPLYHAKMQKLNADLDPDVSKLMTMELLSMGYSRDVFEDELQAYLATSNADDMNEIFGMAADVFERVSKPYIEVFYSKS